MLHAWAEECEGSHDVQYEKVAGLPILISTTRYKDLQNADQNLLVHEHVCELQIPVAEDAEYQADEELYLDGSASYSLCLVDYLLVIFS